MLATGRAAREGARALRLSTPGQRSTAILAAAEAIRDSAATILAANAADFAAAKAAGLSAPMLDRMMLDEARLAAVADAVAQTAVVHMFFSRYHTAGFANRIQYCFFVQWFNGVYVYHLSTNSSLSQSLSSQYAFPNQMSCTKN